MQHSDIYRIAFESIPAAASNVFANAKCLQMSDPAMEDQGWKDVFGNSCEWYHKHRIQFPELCSGQDVRAACPQVSVCVTVWGKSFVFVERCSYLPLMVKSINKILSLGMCMVPR